MVKSLGKLSSDGGGRAARRRIVGATLLATVAVVILVFWSELANQYDLRQGKLALENRTPERAIWHFQRVVERTPSHAAGHFGLARCFRHRGEMTEVRKHLGIALTLGYSEKAVVREEWLALAQSGQLREAEPHLSELLQDAGDDGQEICEAFVNGFFLATRFAQALELLDVWKKSFPEAAQPYLFQGRYLEIHGGAAAALDAYREGVKRAPKRRDLRVGLARCLVLVHEHEEASKVIRELRREMPNDPEVLEQEATNCLQQAQLEDARRALDVLLRQQPTHSNGRLLQARLLLQEEKKEEALPILEDLAANRPYDIEARYTYALALLAAGQKERANAEFQFVSKGRETMSRTRGLMEQVSKKEPASVELRYEIGVALLQYESPQAGAGWLRSALDIDPHHRPTHEALAGYYEQQRNSELARFHRLQATSSPDDARILMSPPPVRD